MYIYKYIKLQKPTVLLQKIFFRLMNRILLLLLLISCVFNFVSCKKNGTPNSANEYTTIEITVENENGEKIEGEYVKMYDEKTYELFKENHLTKALAESKTNKDGKATFTLENSKWFDGKNNIDLMFAVVEHIDNNNYKFSSQGGTISKNQNAKFTIVFQYKSQTPVSALVIENGILKGITDKNLTSIVLPSNIKEIADNVFEGSDITEIILNEGIEKIGDECFLESKIRNINFPSSLKNIGKAAFQDCKQLEKVDLSKTEIEVLSEAAFIDSGLKEILLPSKLKEISSESFSGTDKLEEITISKSTVEIGYRAFYNSGLKLITLHNNLKTIGHMAFANCPNLTKVEKSSEKTQNNEGIVEIGAFQNCPSLTEATLPDNITEIEGYTFIECAKLEKISLPKNLKKIGDLGLRTNYNVSTIIFSSPNIPELSNAEGSSTPNVLPFVANIKEILVPAQSVEEYKTRLSSYSKKIKGI